MTEDSAENQPDEARPASGVLDVDRRGRLQEEVFSYRVGKDQKVVVFWQGRQVKILRPPAAQKFLKRVEGLDPFQLQLALAKLTGNFKRGNER